MASSFKPPYVPTWEGAMDYLGSKDSRRISGNTRLYRIHENAIGLELHNTTIVQYRSNGQIVIKNGGYQTNTTKRYINGAAPCSVFQKDFQWYVKDVPELQTSLGLKAWDGEPLQVAMLPSLAHA